MHFLGRPIRHGGMYPIWHMRLFRHGSGRCEARRYDQHFYVDGPTDRLNHPMIDDIRMPLGEWVIRHNRWADAEADELLHGRQRRHHAQAGRQSGRAQARAARLLQPPAALPARVPPVPLSLRAAARLPRRTRRADLLRAPDLLVPLPGRRQAL
ncbi:MAG: hypothetical protein WDO24_19595 [Pseudomonadota bacterium]